MPGNLQEGRVACNNIYLRIGFIEDVRVTLIDQKDFSPQLSARIIGGKHGLCTVLTLKKVYSVSDILCLCLDFSLYFFMSDHLY